MEPITTWIVLADAHAAKVMVHRGPGKGLTKADALSLTARPPVEYSDEPGRSFSSHGHGSSGMIRRDPGRLAEAEFARSVADLLTEQNRTAAFDRLVLIAAPHMLGALRKALDKAVVAKVTAEIDKDLMKVPDHELAEHLAGKIVV